MIWAGGAGCHYGWAGSCDVNGSNDFKRLGMIIDESISLDGFNDYLGEPLLLADSGLITRR